MTDKRGVLFIFDRRREVWRIILKGEHLGCQMEYDGRGNAERTMRFSCFNCNLFEKCSFFEGDTDILSDVGLRLVRVGRAKIIGRNTGNGLEGRGTYTNGLERG